MNRLLFRPEVEDDLAEASSWYEERRTGLGNEFTEAVEQILDRVAGNPLRFALVNQDVRCARLRRFPFGIYYHVLREPVVVILAVLHHSRDPNHWKRRRSADTS